MTMHEVVVATTVTRGLGIEDVTEYVQYTDPDTVNTNHHPFKQCALRHTEQRDDIHCYTCGGEEDNGRHTPPYGDGAD